MQNSNMRTYESYQPAGPGELFVTRDSNRAASNSPRTRRTDGPTHATPRQVRLRHELDGRAAGVCDDAAAAAAVRGVVLIVDLLGHRGRVFDGDAWQGRRLAVFVRRPDDGTAAAPLSATRSGGRSRGLRIELAAAGVGLIGLGVRVQLLQRTREVGRVDDGVWRVLVAHLPASRGRRRRGDEKLLLRHGGLQVAFLVGQRPQRGVLAKVDADAVGDDGLAIEDAAYRGGGLDIGERDDDSTKRAERAESVHSMQRMFDDEIVEMGEGGGGEDGGVIEILGTTS